MGLLDPILQPLGITPPKPQNLGNTDAAKDASNFASDLVDERNKLPAPTYSTAPTIQTTAPTPPPSAPAPPSTPRPTGPPTGTGTGVPTPTSTTTFTGLGTGGQKTTSDGRPVPGPADPNIVGGARPVVNGLVNPNQVADDAAAREWAEYDRKKSEYDAQLAEYQRQKASYDEYQRIIGGDAQQVAGPQQVSATTVGQPTTSFVPNQVIPQDIAAPTGVTAQQIGALPLTTAMGVTAPVPVGASTVTADQIGPMSLQNLPADIDVNSFGRDAQLRALMMSEAAARGEAPSAAEALLRKGIDESIGAAMGIAATTQGRNPGLAMRQGQTAAANAIAKSSADMAALRADEQARARSEVLSAATGIRTGDIAIAQSNQTKNLTASVENLRTQLETAKANQETALRAGLGNQAAQLQADIANMTAQLDAAKTTAELSLRSDIANLTASLDASKANQAASLNADIANMTAQLETAKANQRAALEAGMANQAADLQNQIAQMNARLEADKANQQALLDAAKANAANQIQTNYQNATLSQQQGQFQSGQALSVAQANQQAGLQTTALNNALYNSTTGNALTALGIPLNVAAGDIARQNAYNQAQSQFYLDLLKTGGALAFGGGGGAAASKAGGASGLGSSSGNALLPPA